MQLLLRQAERGAVAGGWSGAKELWLTGKNQPGACEPLFSAWRDSGQQDPLAYLERIRPAMKAGNIGLVKSLAQQMPANYQSIASAVVAPANDPNSVLTFARTTGATDFTVRWPPSPSPASPAGTWKMPA